MKYTLCPWHIGEITAANIRLDSRKTIPGSITKQSEALTTQIESYSGDKFVMHMLADISANINIKIGKELIKVKYQV